MAKIFPFRGLRYNPSKVKLAEVVTQPYDKITPEMQDRYYGSSPYNLVRIILGKPQAGDNEQESVYTRAAASLQQWRSDGVLVPDDEPSLYLYTQTFRVPGDTSGAVMERRGFIALGQVEDYDQKVVFRHEQTLSKPKADRLNLLRATQSHFGQIFMLYSDPAAEIDAALRQSGPPTAEVRDEYDVLHRMWKISDPGVIQAVQAKMADKKLIIADGHHRYETALNYRNEMRKQAGARASEPYERVMMTFVNMDAPGLVILPTHRVVFGLEDFSIFGMVAKLQVNFEVEDLGPLTGDRNRARATAPSRSRSDGPAGGNVARRFPVALTAGHQVERRSKFVGAATRPGRGATCTSWCWKERWGCRKKTFATRSTCGTCATRAKPSTRCGKARMWRSS